MGKSLNITTMIIFLLSLCSNTLTGNMVSEDGKESFTLQIK